MGKQNLWYGLIALWFFLPSTAMAAVGMPGNSHTEQASCSGREFTFELKDYKSNSVKTVEPIADTSRHSVVLELKNKSKAVCRLSPMPKLGFEDKFFRTLKVTRRWPRFMGVGPVLRPLIVAPKDKVHAVISWFSGAANDQLKCVSSAFITLTIGKDVLRTSFDGQLCGTAKNGPYYEYGWGFRNVSIDKHR